VTDRQLSMAELAAGMEESITMSPGATPLTVTVDQAVIGDIERYAELCAELAKHPVSGGAVVSAAMELFAARWDAES
jgi:hypothetical protein